MEIEEVREVRKRFLPQAQLGPLDAFQQVNLFPVTAEIPYPLVVAFLALPVTPPLLQLLEKLLEEERLDATEGLIAYALRLQDEWDLYAAALCLRNGAKTNVYVSSQASGESMHLLASVIASKVDVSALESIQENSLLWRLLVLLHMYDVQIDYPLFNNTNFLETKTVKEWLGTTWSVYAKLPKKVSETSETDKFYYAALSGFTEDLVLSYAVTESEYLFLVKSRTYSVLTNNLSLEKITTTVEVDSVLSVLAMQYYNEKALLDYIQNLALISYLLTNELCLRCQDPGQLSQIWATTLVTAVSYGLPLDNLQYAMVKHNETLKKELLKAYHVPYWQKFLTWPKQRDFLPARVQQLAVAICGEYFDADLQLLRASLEDINSLPDKGTLSKALVRRERLKIIANKDCLDHSLRLKEEVEILPVYSEQGFTRLPKNPFLLLPEYRILFRHQGNLYILYSFDYRHAEQIPEVRALPDFARRALLEEIYQNVRRIQKEGGDVLQPKTFLELIEGELAPDTINDKESNAQLSEFFVALGGLLAVNNNLSRLYNGIYNLQELTPEHALVSLAYLYNELRKGSTVRGQELHNLLLKEISL